MKNNENIRIIYMNECGDNLYAINITTYPELYTPILDVNESVSRDITAIMPTQI